PDPRDHLRPAIARVQLDVLVRQIERLASAAPLPPALHPLLERFRTVLAEAGSEHRRSALKVGELIGRAQPGMVQPGEPWSDALVADVEGMDAAAQAAWRALLAHAATAVPARPTRTWLREARPLVDSVGREELERRALHWFELLAEQTEGPRRDRNTDVARGLVWTCS